MRAARFDKRIAGLALAALAGAVAAPGSNAPGALVTASSEFWRHWGDGRAELSGYAATTNRYGELRDGRIVLIYVTEPMDRRTWIKDDRGDVPSEERVNVLKLNHVLEFRTGIYPYSVMTSTFAPVDRLFSIRFSPAKISFSAREWCGHVYHQIKPAAHSFVSDLHSYFESEGDRIETVPIEPDALYEDALFIQLRELDGPFNGGKSWEGTIVPSLWSLRKRHAPARPLAGTIRRADATRNGTAVTRFTLRYGDVTRTFDVEKAPPQRILGWSSSDGEQAKLLKTARLPYWKLNKPGNESYLDEIGLKPE